MPKYKVLVNVVAYSSGYVEVEAPSKKKARELIEDEGDFDDADLEGVNREVEVLDIDLK
jgi:hypothetical protein